MQRYPQSPQGQRPAARPQQAYSNPQNASRPAVRPAQQAAARPAVNRQQQPGTRPVSSPQGYPSRQQPSAQRAYPAGQQPVRRSPVQQSTSAAQNARRAPAQPVQRRPVQSNRSSVQRPNPTSSAFTGRADHRPLIITAAAAALIAVIGCLMQFVIYPAGFFPSDTAKAVTTVAEISSSRGVRINEVMTSNKTALGDSEGSYPDWIELINTTGSTIDITGWSLLDKATRTSYFTFPEYQLDAGEIVLVFASGHLENENGSDFHAPFRLSSAGDTLMLSDAHNTVVESINIPALGGDQSYAHMDGGWTITSEYTPGLENTLLSYAALTSTQPVSGSPLKISEVMADNASFKAPDGGLYDWIEISNTGSAAVDLKGYALSDTPDKPAQWKFPSVQLNPGQSIVVYASGLNQQSEDGSLHTGFGLRAEGESVLLYNPQGQVLDFIEFDNLKTDCSFARQADGSYASTGSPTPGQAN